MIWPFKKKYKADAVLDIMDDAIMVSSNSWIQYNNLLKFKDSVSLKEIIFGFSIPNFEGLQNKFPALRNAPSAIMLMITAYGVVESGTHTEVEVENALDVELPERTS